MAFRGVMQRLADEEAGASSVEKQAARLAGEQLTAVQAKAVEVLTELVNLGAKLSAETSEAPTGVKMLILMLEKGRPMIADGISGVPDSVIVEFMRGMRDNIDSIVKLGGTDGNTGAELGDPLPLDIP